MKSKAQVKGKIIHVVQFHVCLKRSDSKFLYYRITSTA